MTTGVPPESRYGAWKNPGLGQAGTVLLLVGWILGIVMAGLALLMGVLFVGMRGFGGRMRDWMMGPWAEGAPDLPFWFMDMWGVFAWFSVGLAVLSFVAIIAGVVLTLLGWQAVVRGDHRRGGMLGIVGGAVMLLFSSLSGAVALLGGVFVLVSTTETPGGGTPRPAPAAPSTPPAEGREERPEASSEIRTRRGP